MQTPQPLVLVHDDKYARADDTSRPGLVMALEDALTIQFPTDAHYQSCRLRSSTPGGELPRVASTTVIPHGDDLIHDVLSFDVDTPGHVPLADAPAAWADQLGHFVRHTDLGQQATFYATRSGYRLLFVLRQPVGYDEYGAALRLLGAELDRAGCPRLDPLFDFARMMRLPLVTRDGAATNPDVGPLGPMRLQLAACTWHPSADDLRAAQDERPVQIRRRLADGTVDGVVYSGHATTPRPAQPCPLPALLTRRSDVAVYLDGSPLSEPGQRHTDTLAALGRVARGLGSHSTPELLYSILHPAYQAMCDRYPDSSLDKLWDLAHHVDARHHARLANGAQPDEGGWLAVAAIADRLTTHGPTLTPEAQAELEPIAAHQPPPVVPGDPQTLEAIYQHGLAAGLSEHVALGFVVQGLQRAATPEQSWPLLVALQAGGAADLWVLDRYTFSYTGPTNPRALLAVLGRCGWAAFEGLIDPAKGALVAPLDRLLATFGAVVQDVSTFYGTASSCDHVDTTSNNGAGTLHLAGARLRDDLTPHYDPQIDGWLRLLAGDDTELHEYLNLWLAAVPRASDVATDTIPALMLLGRKNVGKTLLAVGLGALWGTTPIGHEEAFSQFNARLARSPVIDGSEFNGSLLRPGRASSGADIRIMISQVPKTLEQKFVAATTLRGAPRLVLSANDFGAWGDSQLDEDAYLALVDRIAVLQPSADAETYLAGVKALDPNALQRWAARGIAEHVLALEARIPIDHTNPLMVPSPRFRVPSFGHTSSVEDVLRRIGDDGKLGLTALVRGALLGYWPPVHQAEDVFVAGADLYVTKNALGALIDRATRNAKASTLRRVLDKLTSIGRATSGHKLPRPLRTRGARTTIDERRYVGVPLDLLESYAEHQGLELDRPACAVYNLDTGALVTAAT